MGLGYMSPCIWPDEGDELSTWMEGGLGEEDDVGGGGSWSLVEKSAFLPPSSEVAEGEKDETASDLSSVELPGSPHELDSPFDFFFCPEDEGEDSTTQQPKKDEPPMRSTAPSPSPQCYAPADAMRMSSDQSPVAPAQDESQKQDSSSSDVIQAPLSRVVESPAPSPVESAGPKTITATPNETSEPGNAPRQAPQPEALSSSASSTAPAVTPQRRTTRRKRGESRGAMYFLLSVSRGYQLIMMVIVWRIEQMVPLWKPRRLRAAFRPSMMPSQPHQDLPMNGIRSSTRGCGKVSAG